MAAKKTNSGTDTNEILRDLLIVQLGIAGVTQNRIREIVGVDMNRVSRIVKHLRKKGERDDAQEKTR